MWAGGRAFEFPGGRSFVREGSDGFDSGTSAPLGNVIAANDTANGNWSYGRYDPLNRLVSSSCTSHCPDGANTQGFSYVYDQYGNRQQQNVTAGSGPQPQYSFNAATNRVTNNGFQYDAAGDVTNDGNCAYTWDAEQHMSSATCPSNNTVTTTYVYDAAGRRVAKEAAGAVTEADVYNTAGQVVSRYGPYPAETWLGDDVWVGGAHLAIYANGQTYFPLTDQVGTERARFASTGGIAESCVSLPFGDGLQCTGSDPDPYHFAKLERDAESGDDHAQHRDYNSIPGRWLSPDPAGVKVVSLTDPQTWNLYVYSDNNPVTDNDPSGLQDCNHDGPCYEKEIVQAAVAAVGSKAYLQDKAKGDYLAGSNKCNEFVADTVEKSGRPRPQVPKSGILGLLGFKRDPTSHEWADPKVKIPGWSGTKPLGQAHPGDVIAQEHNSLGPYGHVGIVVGPSSTVSVNSATNPKGIVTSNDWGFRGTGSNGETSTDPAPVVRSYIGDR